MAFDITCGGYAMTDTILYSRAGHIGRLTLNNPERHNSLGQEELEAIRDCLTRVEADDEVRVLIVTGAGDKTLSAHSMAMSLAAAWSWLSAVIFVLALRAPACECLRPQSGFAIP
jgi:enoyl-CoA hydratase/carnithine racemase